MMYYEESDYIRGLSKYLDLDRKTWLIRFFEMYKSTLNWPPGLPPIPRCYMYRGTLREKFHSTYKNELEEFPHRLNNDKQSLVFL